MAANSLTKDAPRTSKEIVCDVEHEENAVRVRALAHELNEAMLSEERRRVAQRLRTRTNPSEIPVRRAA
jgi:hypothetical protein